MTNYYYILAFGICGGLLPFHTVIWFTATDILIFFMKIKISLADAFHELGDDGNVCKTLTLSLRSCRN